jgi:hypothetical protein
MMDRTARATDSNRLPRQRQLRGQRAPGVNSQREPRNFADGCLNAGEDGLYIYFEFASLSENGAGDSPGHDTACRGRASSGINQL